MTYYFHYKQKWKERRFHVDFIKYQSLLFVVDQEIPYYNLHENEAHPSVFKSQYSEERWIVWLVGRIYHKIL